MKKNFRFAILSAIALTGAVTITGCSSSDEIVNNPNYNPETNSVKTEVLLSIANIQNKANTRQSTAVTQSDGTLYNGLTNMYLIPFSEEVGESSTKLGPVISLADISSSELLAVSNSKVYTPIEVPSGTKYFLFYGKQGETTGATTLATRIQSGFLTITGLGTSGSGNPSDILFEPKAIYGDYTPTTDIGASLVSALNSIVQVTNFSTNAGLYDLFQRLKGLTVCSSTAVEKTLDMLYQNVRTYYGVDDGSTGTVGNAIITTMAALTDVTVPSGGGEGHVTLGSTLTGYPANIGLPDGAARLAFDDSNNTFTVVTTGNTGLNITAYSDYVYPAALYYRANSGIKTSTVKQSGSYTGNNWATILGLYTEGEMVTQNTQSIAIKDPIEYMVGRLDTKVYADVVASGDDAGKIYDKIGNPVSPNFTLTGVLIADQKGVKWNGKTNATSTGHTLYDQIMSSTITVTSEHTASSPAGTNQTLVLESMEEDNSAINVALEFQNAGTQAFEVLDGIVYPGEKFYMKGQLSKNSATTPNSIFAQDYITTATFKIGQGTAGASGSNGLSVATLGLPDLRKNDQELGLSVNLEWKAGLNLTVEF